MFEDKIKALEPFDNLVVEIIGDEIWVSGDTRAHHAALKGIGFFFAPLKQMWHWKASDSNTKNHLNIDSIRRKYGVTSRRVTTGL